MPSAYIVTARGVRALLSRDDQQPFSAWDVVDLAAGADPAQPQPRLMSEAQKILARGYHDCDLVRFGVVPAAEEHDEDYVRCYGKVLYAPAGAWRGRRLHTPTGVYDGFVRLDDPIRKNGRRRGGGDRHDLAPTAEDHAISAQIDALQQQIARLQRQRRDLTPASADAPGQE